MARPALEVADILRDYGLAWREANRTHVSLEQLKVMSAIERCRTTKLKNAHRTEFREVLYRWHPWFGLQVGVHEAIGRSDCIVFRCNLSGSNTDRWLEVPAWMFDRSACARVRVAINAHADLAALTELAALFRQVLGDRLAPPNAPLLSASILPHDQNRGEVHATPDEAAGGASQRAATNRPVRRRTVDGRRHAGLVGAAGAEPSGTDRADDTVDPGACRQKPARLDDRGRP